jgi:hypothetical protein
MRKGRCPAATTTCPSRTIRSSSGPRALLEAARVNETQLAERATGYYWGEPRLRPYVESILADAERAQDERLEQVARRFLR